MSLLAVSLIFLAAIVGITVGAVLLTSKMTDMLIGSKHRAIEEILQTGQIPAAWHARDDKRIARLSQDPAQMDRVAALKRKAQARYLKQLDGVINYLRVTRLVENEETRRSAMEQLQTVRQKLTLPAGASVPPPDASAAA